jgi:ATP-dependent helicase/DNAse subunit B
MLEQEKTAAISGMYYSEVRNDFASIGTGGRKTTVQNQLAKNTCLNGVTFVDVDEDGAIKAESVDRVESEYARENGSLFFGNQIKLGNSVQSRSNGEQLIKKVRKNICDMDSEIRSGCIKLSPRRESNKHDSCKFCAYSAVCKFDEDLAEIRSISESDNEIWKRLEDEE